MDGSCPFRAESYRCVEADAPAGARRHTVGLPGAPLRVHARAAVRAAFVVFAMPDRDARLLHPGAEALDDAARWRGAAARVPFAGLLPRRERVRRAVRRRSGEVPLCALQDQWLS